MIVGVNDYQDEHAAESNIDLAYITCVIADNLIKCLYLLVTLTMYHLYLGLTFVNRKKTVEEIHRSKKVAEIVFLVLLAITVLIATARATFLNGPEWIKFSAVGNLAFADLLFIGYVVVIVNLRRQMKMLQGMA